MGYDRESKVFPEETSWCFSRLQDVKQIYQAAVTVTCVSADRESPVPRLQAAHYLTLAAAAGRC